MRNAWPFRHKSKANANIAVLIGVALLGLLIAIGPDVALATQASEPGSDRLPDQGLPQGQGWSLHVGAVLGLVLYGIVLWRTNRTPLAHGDSDRPNRTSHSAPRRRAGVDRLLGRAAAVVVLLWVGTGSLLHAGFGGWSAPLYDMAFWASIILPGAHGLVRLTQRRAPPLLNAAPPTMVMDAEPPSPSLFDLVLKHVEQVGDSRTSPRPRPPPLEVETGYGEVVAIRSLMQDVAELTIAMHAPLAWRPGQHIDMRFEGFPARAYCPTVAMDGRDVPGTFRLHVKRLEGGRVSGEIGRSIRIGHRVAIDGPDGTGFLRAGQRGRLVLYADGIGFAPIWAIADAARRESAERDMVIVVGVRSINAFYMAEALERMARCNNIAVLPMVAEPQTVLPQIGVGLVSSFAHILAPGDVVHAAGAPSIVDALAARASALGLAVNAVRLTPSQRLEPQWHARAAEGFVSAPRHLWPTGVDPRPYPALQSPVSQRNVEISRRGSLT